MKPLSIFIILFIFSTLLPVKAQKKTTDDGISWLSLSNAVETNTKNKKKNKKKFFIDVYTDWCGWCKKMESSTFKDSEVIEVMNKYFLAVKFNAESKDTVIYNSNTYINPSPGTPRSTHQLAITLLQGQMAYPAFVFLDKEGTIITNVKGYREPKDLIPILKYYGEDIYLTQKWADYQKSLITPDK